LSVIFVPPFLGFDTFMEAQDDYFVNLFTPLYKILSNPQGLLYEITMNSQHYKKEENDGVKSIKWKFGKWAQLETLLHEQVHLWQQNFGDKPVKPGKPYHMAISL